MSSWVTTAARRCTMVHRVASRTHTSTTRLQSLGSISSPRVATSHSPRLIRRELSSLFPVHSAVSSSRLVSRLAVEASFCAEGRFANYLSPI